AAPGLSVVLDERHQPATYRIALEEPLERGAVRLGVPDGRHQGEQVRPALRTVRNGGEGHFVEVPSAAFRTRRARVPVTVSLTAIRSQAPESTSSNVRTG